jgi:glycosyltransferase involved in cell wall biosynthesis
MYAIFRSFYRGLDNLVLQRLPLRAQLALKRAILAASRTLYPTRIVANDASQLLRAPAGDSSSWSWRPPVLPNWVKEEMLALAAIDLDLHPEGKSMRAIEFHSAAWTFDIPGLAYAKLWREVGRRKYDCVIFVPWLKRGGADLGAILTANALASRFGASVLVVTTMDSDSPWSSRLNSDVTFLEVGAALRDVDPVYRIDVIVRLLLQLSPSVVHIMNSSLAWEAVARNGLALRQSMKLYASLYCDDIGPLGLPDGYARTYLPGCYPYLDAVITDNTRNPKQWVRKFGVPAQLFKVVPFPAPPSTGEAFAPTAPGRAVLWAGRLDRQKRPELLAALAKALPDVRFDVHGEPVLETNDLNWLQEMPNVVYHGAFESFHAIVKADHSAFVYTTAWDGMPLVLLDAANAGLPIVAPDIGGIGDFICERDILNTAAGVQEYIMDIELLLANPDKREERIQRQYDSLRVSRGFDMFLDSLGKLDGYAQLCENFSGAPKTVMNSKTGRVQ